MGKIYQRNLENREPGERKLMGLVTNVAVEIQ